MTIQLYNYFRSTASYRVRIALALKGLAYDYLPVHLARGEQSEAAYRSLVASQLVPALKDDEAEGSALLTQSMAIIEYLDETRPEPPLLPGDALARARVRALAQDIACDLHPLNNLRVLRYLTQDLKLGEDDKNRWIRHWVDVGLTAVERQLATHPATGRFCHGDAPTLADCVLVPQIFNAQRFDCRLDHVPTVMRIHDECMRLDAFVSTRPAACPDAS